jgi:hypothetical protein
LAPTTQPNPEFAKKKPKHTFANWTSRFAKSHLRNQTRQALLPTFDRNTCKPAKLLRATTQFLIIPNNQHRYICGCLRYERYAVEASANEDSPPTKLTAKGAINLLEQGDRPTYTVPIGRAKQPATTTRIQ